MRRPTPADFRLLVRRTAKALGSPQGHAVFTSGKGANYHWVAPSAFGLVEVSVRPQSPFIQLRLLTPRGGWEDLRSAIPWTRPNVTGAWHIWPTDCRDPREAVLFSLIELERRVEILRIEK